MGFISLLALVVVALLVIMLKFVIDGVREKNWKKSIISVIVFLAVILLLCFGLICFITSM